MQQQDQINAMSALTAYLREAQVQQQAQNQAQAQPTHPPPQETHSGDPSWAAAMSERQQLAFRSLSEAAVDHRHGGRRSSEMLRASIQAPTAASASFPGDIIQPQMQPQANPHMSNVSTAGKPTLLHSHYIVGFRVYIATLQSLCDVLIPRTDNLLYVLYLTC